MAGSIAITYQEIIQDAIHKVTLDWLSAAGGTVSANLTKILNGEIERVVFVPDSGGTQPTDQYDVLLKDDDGLDLLAGQGANLSNAAASHVKPGVPFKDGTTTSTAPIAVAGKLELDVSNAGAAKGGQVIVYLK